MMRCWWWLVVLLALRAGWSAEGPAAVRAVVVLIHGVNSGPVTYERFKQRVWAAELPETALLEMNYGREHCVHASGSVGERSHLAVGMSDQAWVGVAKLKDVVAQCRALLGPDVPITVLCHSQGAVIAVAALQEGMTIDGLVMMGATLGTSSVRTGERNTRLGAAARQVRGPVLNLWSPDDHTIQAFKHGIGGWGLPATLPDRPEHLRDVRITQVPHSGDDGWWSMAWLLPGFHGRWLGATRAEVLALLRGPGPARALDPAARTAFAALQDYASRDTRAGWYGRENDNAFRYTFTLTPGMQNGIYFGNKDTSHAEVACREGAVRCRIVAAPWFVFDRGTAWTSLRAGETAVLDYTLPDGLNDAVVSLQVEALGGAIARAECRFTARDR